MNLIAIVIALASERMLSHLRRYREYDWMLDYLRALRSVPALRGALDSGWGLLALVPPLVLVALIQGVLHGGLLSLLGLVFSVAVLIFSLGPRDLWEEVHALIDARETGDMRGADALAADLCCFAGNPPVGRVEGHAAVRAVVLQGCERVFGVLLWFFLLGPLGAALYRISAELPRQLRTLEASAGVLEPALRLHGILAWVPVRIVALVYGLAGSTDGALHGWRAAHAQPAADWVSQSWRVLAYTGCGALQIEPGADHRRVNLGLNETLREALSLVNRSLAIMLAVLALFTIGGWVA